VYWYNFVIQVLAIVFYSVMLFALLHNFYFYLILKKRYKVLTHDLFYFFAILLAIFRILQHAFSFNYFYSPLAVYLNELNDGFSVCIGVSQIVVVSEMVVSMQLLEKELDTMEMSLIQKAHNLTA
jgi:hypothetical protein